MNKRHNVPNQSYNILIASLLAIGVMMTVTGCDNNQKVEDDKKAKEIAEPEITKTAPDDTNTKNELEDINIDNANVEIDTNASQSDTLSESSNIVSPDGYKGLQFNQVITPEVLKTHGLSRGDDIGDDRNDDCYFVSDPEMYITNELGNNEPLVLYQIVEGRLELIRIEHPNIPFYTGIKKGDSVQQVMQQHKNVLDYQIGEHSVDSEYYYLISNINFSVAKDTVEGTFIERDNILLNKGEDVPLQIKYAMIGGKDMGSRTIHAGEWNNDNLENLTGKVGSISIGLPEAISVEGGCA